MTPEDRAAALWWTLRDDVCKTWPPDDDDAIRRVSAAIREAVDAETEACAALLERDGICRCYALARHDPDCAWVIAQAIRQRAAARRPAAPAETTPAP